MILRHWVASRYKPATDSHRLRSVCRWWNAAITNCPGIWSEIRGHEIRKPSALQRALKYSRDEPLNIYIVGGSRLALVVLPELASQRHRWRTLDIDFQGLKALALVAKALNGPAPLLQKAWIRNLGTSASQVEPVDLFGGWAPVLRELVLEGFTIPPEPGMLSGLHSLELYRGQIFELEEAGDKVLANLSKVLQCCPLLRELTVEYLGMWPSEDLDVPTLEFRHLERLDIRLGASLVDTSDIWMDSSLLPIIRSILAPTCRHPDKNTFRIPRYSAPSNGSHPYPPRRTALPIMYPHA